MRESLARQFRTTGRLDASDVLLLGAGLGVLGWVTTALAAEAAAAPGVTALVLWGMLVAVMLLAIGRHAVDEMRFSTPLVGWGFLNGVTTVMTVGAVVVGAPQRVVWSAWATDLACGYAWTAFVLAREHSRERAVGYGIAALLGLTIAGYGTADPTAFVPAQFSILAVVHATPLALDARGYLDGTAGQGVLIVVVASAVASTTLLGP